MLAPGARSLLLGVSLLSLLVVGLLSPLPLAGAGASSPTVGAHLPSSDPRASASTDLCTSGGPTILGVEWNCVAILDLTEFALMLASIGIVAWVFWDEDKAELPGESAEVPITATEWAAYREERRLGLPYEPPEPPERDEET